MEPEETIEDFLNNLLNDRETLSVHDYADTEQISEEEIVKTTYVVKLTINNIVYDELVLIVKGDVDGDGYATVADMTKMNNLILRKTTFTFYQEVAADIDIDSYVTVADMTKIQNHILRKIKSLNTDLYEYYENS